MRVAVEFDRKWKALPEHCLQFRPEMQRPFGTFRPNFSRAPQHEMRSDFRHLLRRDRHEHPKCV